MVMIDNPNEVNKLTDYINMIIKKGSIQVAGKEIRAMVETSPRRWEHLRPWFQAREPLSQLHPMKEWAVCERAGDLEREDDEEVGLQRRHYRSWTWNQRAAAQESLRLPVDITAAPDMQHMQQKEEDMQQDAYMKVEGEGGETEKVGADKDLAVTPRDGQCQRARQEAPEHPEQILQRPD